MAMPQLLKPVDNFETTLSSAINNSTLTIPCSSLTALGTVVAGIMCIDPDNSSKEYVYFENVSGSDLVITTGGRGKLNTSAVSHSQGATVRLVYTSPYISNIVDHLLVAHNDDGTHKTGATYATPTISGHPTIEGVTSTGATGTGKLVFDTSPTISGHPTVEGVTSTGATGTGKYVFDAAPTIDSPTATTKINVPSSTEATTSFALDCTPTTAYSLADNATRAIFGNANAFSGLLIVNNQTDGNVGLFITGATVMTLISQTGTTFSSTKDTASKINAYVDAANSFAITVQNKTGGSKDLRIMAFRTRTTN